jgi:hypothetical protein
MTAFDPLVSEDRFFAGVTPEDRRGLSILRNVGAFAVQFDRTDPRQTGARSRIVLVVHLSDSPTGRRIAPAATTEYVVIYDTIEVDDVVEAVESLEHVADLAVSHAYRPSETAVAENRASLALDARQCSWCGAEVTETRPPRSRQGEEFCTKAHRAASAAAVRRLRGRDDDS